MWGHSSREEPGIVANYNTSGPRDILVPPGSILSLNTVEMDGVQLANSNSGGSNRNFDFFQASISMVESIEVTKAPRRRTCPASSIGGSINMVTRSAVQPGESAERHFFLRLRPQKTEASWRPGGTGQTVVWRGQSTEFIPLWDSVIPMCGARASGWGSRLTTPAIPSTRPRRGSSYSYQATLGSAPPISSPPRGREPGIAGGPSLTTKSYRENRSTPAERPATIATFTYAHTSFMEDR